MIPNNMIWMCFPATFQWFLGPLQPGPRLGSCGGLRRGHRTGPHLRTLRPRGGLLQPGAGEGLRAEVQGSSAQCDLAHFEQ